MLCSLYWKGLFLVVLDVALSVSPFLSHLFFLVSQVVYRDLVSQKTMKILHVE